MMKSARSKADKAFSASEKRADRLIAEKAEAQVARMKKTERLKALRLAKDAGGSTEE